MTDEATFTEWYAAYYPDLVRYAHSFVNDAERARDIVQEAFLRLWKRRRQIDTNRPVRALLYRAVRNLALNERRNLSLRRTLLHRITGRSHSAPPDEATDARLLGAEMRRWIEALSPRCREAFEMSRFHGFSYEEIATIMDVSTKTVENHILRALKVLRDRLNALDPHLLKP